MVGRVLVVLAGLVAIGGAHTDAAQSVATCLRTMAENCGPGRTVAQIDGEVTPQALPKRKSMPIEAQLRAAISTDAGGHPSALRKVTVELDRQLSIDATGLPSCGRRRVEQLKGAAARRACRKAIVGGGKARIGSAEPGAAMVTVPLIVFNGGVREGVTRLLIHGSTGLDRDPAIATVRITSRGSGKGQQAVATLPRLLDGSGSLHELRLTLARRVSDEGNENSLLSARCPRGRLEAEVLMELRDEANAPTVPPRTELVGGLVVPCKPRS